MDDLSDVENEKNLSFNLVYTNCLLDEALRIYCHVSAGLYSLLTCF